MVRASVIARVIVAAVFAAALSGGCEDKKPSEVVERHDVRRIRATNHGFSPYRVEVIARRLVHFEFSREPDAMPCTKDLVIPDLGIHRTISHKRPTRIDLTLEPGVYPFTSGKHMMTGEIVAR